MDWLLAPIDAARAHEVGWAVSWHGRSMVLAWGLMAPLAVLIARYFKVMPGQDWPRELDNQTWWRSHWLGQTLVVGLTVFGIALVFGGGGAWNLHARLGYAVLVLALAQVGFGLFRGTKGGPSDTDMRGDHYDMTPWRVMFEWVHKLAGYTLLLVAMSTVALGMWHANAPVWMWLGLGLWWSALAIAAIHLQRRGYAIDTYQAIWGPGPEHPGNRRKPIGWGIRRPTGQQPGE
ncbi:MAG: cytochrome b561 domain-containing protein [Pseudomonadota bacterium]